MMQRWLTITVGILLCYLPLVVPGQCGEAEGLAHSGKQGQHVAPPSFSPEQFDQVAVLLRNGHVIEGKLLSTDEFYRIKVSHGLICVARRDVLAVAGTIRELYYQQRSRLFAQDPEAHLELAIWCAEHGLPIEARAELEEARKLAPSHPGLALASRRVEMTLARRREDGSSRSIPLRTSESTNSLLEQKRSLNLGHQRPAEGAAISSSGSVPRISDPSILLRGWPEEAREDFVRLIQPILSHNCASAACHGGPNVPPSARLFRLLPDRYALRGQTAQNLQTVLGWIDFSQPGASPILTKPLQPHGGRPSPVFSGTDMKQYRDLVDWVYRVTRQRTPPLPEELSGEEASSLSASSLGGAAGINLEAVLPRQDTAVQAANWSEEPGRDHLGVIPASGATPASECVSSERPTPGQSVIGNGTSLPTHPVRFRVGQFLREGGESSFDLRFTFGPPNDDDVQRLIPSSIDTR